MNSSRTLSPARRRIRRLLRQLCCLLLVLFLNCHAVIADTTSDRRASVGMNLFKALLLADMDVAEADQVEPIHVLVLYADDVMRADQYRAELSDSLAEIRGIPVQVEAVSIADYVAMPTPAVPGAFLAQRLGQDELQPVIAHSAATGVALFSPFEGDVERGVLAGISVQAAVRPYINAAALQQSGVRLKPFFLKVAKLYGQGAP